MKTVKSIYWMMVALTTIILASCNVTSHVESAKHTNLARYKSFAWLPSENKQYTNSILENDLKDGINEALKKEGFRYNPDRPDLLIKYDIAVDKQVRRESSSVYSNPLPQYILSRGRIFTVMGPSMYLGNRSYNIPYNQGVVTISFIDAKTNEMIWQGWAESEVNSRNLTSKELNREVKAIAKRIDKSI